MIKKKFGSTCSIRCFGIISRSVYQTEVTVVFNRKVPFYKEISVDRISSETSASSRYLYDGK